MPYLAQIRPVCDKEITRTHEPHLHTHEGMARLGGWLHTKIKSFTGSRLGGPWRF